LLHRVDARPRVLVRRLIDEKSQLLKKLGELEVSRRAISTVLLLRAFIVLVLM
jgi:hypothetical protein